MNNENANPALYVEAEETPTVIEYYNGKENLRSDNKRMVDFLPIVKKIRDPSEALDTDSENAWTKVPRDWRKLLLGQKAATDPQTQALVHQAAQVAQTTGQTVTPPQPHVPTIEELEASKNMFV